LLNKEFTFRASFRRLSRWLLTMGEIVSLDDRRKARDAVQPLRVQCYVDLSCPFSYLTAERVERTFAKVTWRLATTTAVERRDPGSDDADGSLARAAAERRAAELRLPLEWPDRYPVELPAAMRVAHLAIEEGRGGAFVLAAGRLAFCGGFDLEDPDILAEAAAAAGIGLDACLRAARDRRRDEPIEATGRRLLAVGADRLPALRVGRSLFWGEQRVGAAAAAVRQATPALARRGV
jgi:2-hydroxychromene-2-carboxylate isomerase